MNIHSWTKHQHFSDTNDKNMMTTLRMSAEAETKVSPFPSFPTKQQLVSVYRQKSTNLDSEQKWKSASRAASADTQSVWKLFLSMEKQENPVSAWQLMILFIFCSPTEDRSARMNTQLPQLIILNRLCCVRMSKALRAACSQAPRNTKQIRYKGQEGQCLIFCSIMSTEGKNRILYTLLLLFPLKNHGPEKRIHIYIL